MDRIDPITKKRLIEWLDPITDEYEIFIFDGKESRPLNVAKDIDFDNSNKRIVIDAHYEEKSGKQSFVDGFNAVSKTGTKEDIAEFLRKNSYENDQ